VRYGLNSVGCELITKIKPIEVLGLTNECTWAGMAGLFIEQRPVGEMGWMISRKSSHAVGCTTVVVRNHCTAHSLFRRGPLVLIRILNFKI
jgi:hypothetical protein